MTPAGDGTCKVCLIPPGFLADCRDSGTRQSYQDFILRTVAPRVRSQLTCLTGRNFVAFFNNHRLLRYDRPVWRTVKGGSQRYVEKPTSPFRDRLRGWLRRDFDPTDAAWRCRQRRPRQTRYYDHVAIVSHSDQALAMLSDADDRERAILGAAIVSALKFSR